MHVTEVKTKDTPVDQEWNKHNAELQPTDPGTKSTGEFGAKGHVFHLMPEWILIISIVLVGKNTLK